MLVTLGTYDLDVAYPHGCSLFITSDKDCHLVPGAGHSPAVMSMTLRHFLRTQKEIERKEPPSC